MAESRALVLADWQLFTDPFARGRCVLSLDADAQRQLYDDAISSDRRPLHLRLPGSLNPLTPTVAICMQL